MNAVDIKLNGSKKVNDPVLYREVQKMNQIWVWLIVAVSVTFSWYWAYKQLLFGKPFGSNPAPDWMTLISLLISGILLPLFFYSIKLVTEVRKDGLYIRFYPFHLSFQTFPFEIIRNYEIQTYNPFRDYGGWGIRYGLKGKAYNTSGNKGVLFEFADGKKVKKLMVGSQTPEKLSEAIGKAIKK